MVVVVAGWGGVGGSSGELERKSKSAILLNVRCKNSSGNVQEAGVRGEITSLKI